MRALIIDDHPIARRGLAAIIGDALRTEDIAFAGNAGEGLGVAREQRPGIVLMDMRIPDSLPPRELCAQLRALLPTAPIVLVTAFGQPAEVRACLEAGASSCLLKDTSEAEMEASLRSIAQGRIVIDPRVAQELATHIASEGSRAGAVHLTAREREVLACLAEGRSNREIAQQLIITETTVKGYVSSLLEKLGAASRLRAVVRAGQLGLL
jgi:DNA-binding NarL/FixJ family response regulator